jgi:hypothetical protein
MGSVIPSQRGLFLPRNRNGETREGSETKLAKHLANRKQTASAFALSSLMALALIILAPPARAVVFNIGGPGGAAGVDMDTTSGLYASGRDEVPTLIAQLGAVAPGGDVFEDLGVPSISPEGDVVWVLSNVLKLGYSRLNDAGRALDLVPTMPLRMADQEVNDSLE